MVVEMGAAAAQMHSVYYRPVTLAEVPALKIEVSVLSELEPIADPLSLEIGKHGIFH